MGKVNKRQLTVDQIINCQLYIENMLVFTAL